MKRIIILYCLLLAVTSFAQQPSLDFFKNMNPRNIGPAGMSGRVTAIDVVESDTEIMYVGTASGGVWKSTSGGIKWKPIFEKELTASIGALAIQQSNPSVIWVGTGEGNPRNSLNGGFGVYKSLDGGKSWLSMGLQQTRHIHRIIIHPTNPDIVYVGAIGSPWGAHKERGVYKTIDGGKTWKQILFNNKKTGVAEMVMDPSNPEKLFVSMWEHKRDPWFFKSGGKASGLYMTHNGGDSWEKITSKEGFPKGDLGRIGVAISKSSPNIVYALVESKKNALYKSDDGGFKWKKINDKKGIGNRPFYYSEIYVDPQNENRLYTIYTYVNVSEDGGKSFKQLMPAYGSNKGVHPDHHAWWIHPNNPKFMIDGNDGGLNITKDGGKSWRFVENLPVGQFYHINVDNEYPYNVYGGMQDNGSWRGPAYVFKAQGIRNSYWQEIGFGDGFDVVPDKDDARFGWSMSQQGYVSRYDYKTGNNYTVRPTHPKANIELRFNWNAAINIDPFDNSTIYFGSQFVHKSKDKGLTWDIISPDLTTNDPKKLKQAESGGLTMDATGAENHCTILVVEPSVLEKNMIWVATDDGQVHITRNGGDSWQSVSKGLKGLPENSWITQIKASNKNKGEALLVANDYRRFNFEPYAYRTVDYGRTWKRIVNAKDVKSYTLSIVEDPIEKNLLFLGTDDGLYVSFNAGDKWEKWTHGFPTVSVKDMVIHPREHDLVVGTFGRSIWVLDDIRPLRAIANNHQLKQEKLVLFKQPKAFVTAYQQASGTRFTADAVFQGANRKRGAMISYSINKKLTKNKKDSITLQIFKANQLIRTLKKKAPKTVGVHRMYWDMCEKGVASVSRKIRKSKSEPRGVAVKPGKYKIKLSFQGVSSESEVEVAYDPRLNYTDQVIDAKYNALKDIEKHKAKMGSLVKLLLKSKKIASNFRTKFKKHGKEKYEVQILKSDEVIDQINLLLDQLLGAVDKRQGITRNVVNNVNKHLGIATWYVQSRYTDQTKTEEVLIQRFKEALQKTLIKSRNFFESDWKLYRKEVEKVKFSAFDKLDVKTIE